MTDLMEHKISLSNKEKLSKLELSEISGGICEHKTHIVLCFEAKQIQFKLEFHYLI